MKLNVLLIGLVLCVTTASICTAEEPDRLQQQINQLNARIQQLQKQYSKETRANEDRVERARKADDRQTSDELLKQAYQSAESIDKLQSELAALQTQKQQLCDQWRQLYREKVDRLLTSADREKDKNKKGQYGKTLQHLQTTNAQLCPQTAQTLVSQGWKQMRIEPYDGPQEIRQKAQLLRDIYRESSITIGRLERQYQDAVREKNTRERAEEFIQESTLFSENMTIRQPAATTAGEQPTGSGTPVIDRFSAESTNTNSSSPMLSSPESQPPKEPGSLAGQYEKIRSQLLSDQQELKKKIAEFERAALRLRNP